MLIRKKLSHFVPISSHLCLDFEATYNYSTDKYWFVVYTDPVHVILKTQETIGWQNVFFKSILTLLCVEYSPNEPSNRTAPYCWSAVTSSTVMNLTCNSTAIDLWVFEVLSQSVVSPLRVAGVLNEDKSKLALHFAGFTLLNASTEEEPSSGGVALFEVPMLSWIFVGLGIVASLLVLSTPAWWDRLVDSWALVAPYTIVNHLCNIMDKLMNLGLVHCRLSDIVQLKIQSICCTHTHTHTHTQANCWTMSEVV